jgi:hypothetical protein
MTRRSILAAVVLLSVAVPVSAEEISLSYRGSTLWSGLVNCEVRDSLAFCAMRPGLVILDVSDPAAPELVSRVYLQGSRAMDLTLHGDYVCVSGWEGAVYVIDVSDPAAPVLAGSCSYPISSPAYGVAAAGDFAYVAYGSGVG